MAEFTNLSPDAAAGPSRAAGAWLAQRGIVCFGGEDWWYHNRGHCDMQFMRQYARCAPVLYVNSIVVRKPLVGEGRMFWRRLVRKARSMSRGRVQIGARMWAYSPLTAPVHHLPGLGRLNQVGLHAQVRWALRGIGLRRPVVWVNCPAACEAALRLPQAALVYQRTDRFEDLPGVDPEQVRRWDRLLKHRADLTFFSNQALFEEERGSCARPAYIDHGVDFERFVAAERDPWVPEELRGLPRPIAGFYGGIDAHTFDLQLLEQVVERLPRVTFVLVGKASIDLAGLRRPNVLFAAQQPYERIAHYGKCFDVRLMPWRQNRWIAACNPIKLKEYLALGKPVVSTPLSELARYAGLVCTAAGAEAFAATIERALREDTLQLRERRRAHVLPDTWAARAEQLLGLLSR